MDFLWVIYLSKLIHFTLQPPLPQIVVNFTKDLEKDYCNNNVTLMVKKFRW